MSSRYLHTLPDSHRLSAKILGISVVITLTFAAVEAIAGYLSASLALMSDAGHMLTDSTALGLSAVAALIAMKPVTARMSYGYGRAEVIAALINGALMLVVVTSIVIAAINRIQNPIEIHGGAVVGVASIGLSVNLLVAYLLSRDKASLNTRAALLRVMADLLGSVAAVLSGVIILLTGWMTIDPILSLVISVLILFSTYRLLQETLRVVMEAVPRHIELDQVDRTMLSVDGIIAIQDLHIWTLSSNQVALSAHVVIDSMQRWETILPAVETLLGEKFNIEHTTIQPVIKHDKESVPVMKSA